MVSLLERDTRAIRSRKARAARPARKRRVRQAASFRFEFKRRPLPGTPSAGIVERWENGNITMQEANNELMLAFARERDTDAYSALFELNEKHFTNIITRRLNGFITQINPADVLQDVFLLIYRYPDKFRADHGRSFYNWSYSIILNTIKRKIKKLGMRTVDLDPFAETLPDDGTVRPLRRLIAAEDVERLKRLYALYLMLYLNAYRNCLSDREREALRLVEVMRLSYQEAADQLGLRYDNFKMIICRTRKKISDGITSIVNRVSTFNHMVLAR
jgi:RNA polymerase sigma factor (sigma-70 family)